MFKDNLKTTSVQSESEIKQFFDRNARSYAEQHGNPQKLLNYRLSLIEKAVGLKNSDTVLDIGCGPGHHLFELAPKIKYGIGVDFSQHMINEANRTLKNQSEINNLSFLVDNGSRLKTICNNSVDVVICVGTFEHMLQKKEMLKQVKRVLNNEGRFVLLTLNKNYIWFNQIAPILNMDYKHLSTDRFLSIEELESLFHEVKLDISWIKYWSFIPKGDMPKTMNWILTVLDYVGKLLKINYFRGGLIATTKNK